MSANLITGLDYFAGAQVCRATGAQGGGRCNIDLGYRLMGYLTDAPYSAKAALGRTYVSRPPQGEGLNADS